MEFVHKAMQIPYIIGTCLIRVPVQFLNNCRLVCKGWNREILEAYFRKNFHVLAQERASSFCILSADEDEVVSVYKMNKTTDWLEENVGIPNLTLIPHPRCIIGSSHGLICIGDDADSMNRFLFLDPSTHLKRFIQGHPTGGMFGDMDSRYAFGYSHIEDDFKLVKIGFNFDDESLESYPNVSVYSVRHKGWCNTREYPDFPISFSTQKCGYTLESRAYFLSSNMQGLIWFDLHTKEFGTLLLPKSFDRSDNISFGAYLERQVVDRKVDNVEMLLICCRHGEKNAIWKLDGSHRFELVTIILSRDDRYERLKPLGFLCADRDQLLLLKGSKIIVFHVQRREITREIEWQEEMDQLCCTQYVESLVSLP